ncbi:MAG: hypothetical protein KBH99_07465 [Syntrophobacteraceae bacterium]|nr:hypothetical protein [Syntrophobacteraceae bacterium]
MKFKSLLLTVLLSVAGSVVLCEDTPNRRVPLRGGWFQVLAGDPRVESAAHHAIAAQAAATGEKLELISVQQARSQVVAGRNYELTLLVNRNGKQVLATAVIWEKLDGSYKLTRWSWQE